MEVLVEITRPNCLKCIHVKRLSCPIHVACGHPDKDNLQVEGLHWAIKRGYFRWPTEYDPVFLVKCNGYEER